MKTIRIALAQINVTVGDLKGNAARISGEIGRAREKGAHLVVFPELAVSGYPPEDLLLKPSFAAACRETLNEIAKATRGIAAIVGYPEVAGDLYNAAAVLCDGKIVAGYRKHFLPNYGVFDEDRYFAPSRDNLVLAAGGFRIGITICEDMWYPAGPHEAQAAAGNANLLVNLSSSPYHRGKRSARERMLSVRATDSRAALAYCNLVGGQDELVFDGGSMIVAPSGELLARGKMFAEDLIVADIKLEDLLREQLLDPRGRKERIEHFKSESAIREVPLPAVFKENASEIAPRITEPPGELEEIYSALVTGTRDYVIKNRFAKTVVGLSGGIDSSLVACVAVDALGAENVVGVSMPSPYSSPHSKSDAESLAKALGIKFLTVPIDQVYEAFKKTLAPVIPQNGVTITEQNIQARARGTILMALSNKFGWLVLTTGNKSELSVGYCTLYGDMAGGFAVIKDVPKVLVYELCRHRNGLKTVIPQSVFEKAPSAELAPDQKDCDSLPEYALLDPVLEAYIERNESRGEMIARGHVPALVDRVIGMVDRAEYKRRQAPPGVKITARALGKDWRLPLTNHYADL